MIGSLLRVWLVTGGVMIGAATDTSPGASQRAIGIALVSLFLISLRRSPLLLVGLAFFGLSMGMLTASVRSTDGVALEELARRVVRCHVEGRVLEQLGGLGTALSVESIDCSDGASLSEAGVMVADLAADAGSRYSADGWLLPLGTTGYDLARADAGAHATFQPSELKLEGASGLLAVASAIRAGLQRSISPIGHDEGALLQGLAIGDTSGIDRRTLDDFRSAGLSHLLAVSGSNVSIVLVGVALLTRRFPFWLRVVSCGSALVLFVLVVGPDPSVLRAAAMGALVMIGLAVGRPAEPLHVLGVGLAVLVAARPQIVFSAGLHLSVAATAGIVLWSPHLSRWMSMLPLLVRLPLAVTLAAQAAVLPLLAGIFGEVSLIAPLANLCAAPAIAPATVLALVAALSGTTFEFLGGAVLHIAEPFAWWILAVGHSSGSPAWASLEVPTWVGAATAIPVGLAGLAALRVHGGPINLE